MKTKIIIAALVLVAAACATDSLRSRSKLKSWEADTLERIGKIAAEAERENAAMRSQVEQITAVVEGMRSKINLTEYRRAKAEIDLQAAREDLAIERAKMDVERAKVKALSSRLGIAPEKLEGIAANKVY